MYGVILGEIVELNCGLNRYTLAPVHAAGHYAIFVDDVPVRWYPTFGEASEKCRTFLEKWPAIRGRNCRVGIDAAKIR